LLASGRVIGGRLTKKLRLAFKGKSDGPNNFGGPINYAAAHVPVPARPSIANKYGQEYFVRFLLPCHLVEARWRCFI